MNDPIDVLMEEHRLIEKGLDALEVFAGKVESGEMQDGRIDLGKFVEFIGEFADRTHHGKEEEILFAEMVKCGFPKEAGPLAVMLSEHDEGRSLVKKLRAYAAQTGEWSAEDRVGIALAGRSFGALLRQHIQKEDNVLYPMAKQRMPQEMMDVVAEASAKFDEAEKAKGENQRLRKLGAELCERYH